MQHITRLLLIGFFAFTTGKSYALQSTGESAETNAHISDNITVFIHSGPARDYRIMGTLRAGEPITILQRDGDPQYIQVVDSDGRKGWVDAKVVSTTPSIREQIPQLEKQITQLTEQVTELQQALQIARSEKDTAVSQSQRLAEELKNARTENNTIQQELDNIDNRVMIEWFTRGGIVAAGGIILGLIISYLPKKRRRGDQWM